MSNSRKNCASQLAWGTPAGTTPDAAYFNNGINHAIAFEFSGSALGDSDSAIYVAHNAWSGKVNFTLPSSSTGTNWYRVTDTCNWAEGPNQVRTSGAEDLIAGTSYVLCGRGIAK